MRLVAKQPLSKTAVIQEKKSHFIHTYRENTLKKTSENI